MTDEEIVKKKSRPKPTSKRDGEAKKCTFPTLARIVSSDGSTVIDIPRLPSNSSELTTYDHMRVAMEYAALATCCLREFGLHPELRVTLNQCLSLDHALLNLQDLMNHLYYAIQGYPKGTGSS